MSLLGRLLLDVVECGPCDPSFVECLVHRHVLHNWTTRGVDEDCRLLHPSQCFPIEETAGLGRERTLDYKVIRAFHKLVKGNGTHAAQPNFGGLEKRIVRPNMDTEGSHSLRDAASDGAEGQQAKDPAAQAPDGLAGLPAPLAAPDCLVVLTNLAGGGEPKPDGMVGNLLGAPFAWGVRNLY